jgi:PhnB protein
MKANVHLNFDGRCKEAFSFYEQALGGKIQFMMTYGESPIASQMPPGTSDYVMHATITIGDTNVLGADAPPGRYGTPQGFDVCLSPDSTAEGERIFNALADGGSIQMPFEKTFWSERFGMVTDRYGIPWMINCASGG